MMLERKPPMHSLIGTAIIDQDGRLKVDLHTALPAGEVEVEILVREPSRPNRSKKRDLSRVVGKLSYKGDPMAIQRELRDEWPE
jgi:hypothetical protein